MEPFPLIEVSGRPYERGLQYGRQAEGRVRAGVGHYSKQIADLSLDAAGIRRLVKAYLPIMEDFDPDYVEEMRGIAEGAGLSFEEVVLVNARTEILKTAAIPALREKLLGPEPDGCTGVIVMPQASQTGNVIHAQNWDWKRDCVDTSVVLHVRRDDGPDILTFTEAGALGRSGINSVGIATTGNYLECNRDYTQNGVPIAFVASQVLESEHLALAMRTVFITPKSASSNMMVSHRGGIAINFECAPDETFQVLPENGLLIHANHWLNPSALAKIQEKGVGNMPDSLYRGIRVRQLLAGRAGQITSDRVKAALLDDFLTPWSVCRPPRPSPSGVLMATVATIVLDPAAGIMEVAPLPSSGAGFTAYRLDVTSKAN